MYVCVCVYVYIYICVCVCVYVSNIILDFLKMENVVELPIMKFALEVTNVNT
jgi:hypothetical protein